MKLTAPARHAVAAYFKIGASVALISTGAAIAFLTAKSPVPNVPATAMKRNMPNKFKGDPDLVGENGATLPGDRDRGPFAAAEEKYAARAYPANDVPFKLVENAHDGWNRIRTVSN